MTEAIKVALIPCAGSVLICLINNWVQFLKNKSDERKRDGALRLGVQMLLRDRINQVAKYHLHNGYITDDDKRTFEDMYRTYEALGANGVMTRKYDKVMNLPEAMEGTDNEKLCV